LDFTDIPRSYVDAWLLPRVLGDSVAMRAIDDRAIPGTETRLPYNVLPLLRDPLACGIQPSLVETGVDPSRIARIRTDVAPLTEYQESALQFALTRRDASFWHCVGSGKTRTALTWGLLTGSRVLYLTRAMARRTTEAEVAKWTTVKCQVCLGTRPLGSVKNPNGTAAALDIDATVFILGYETAPHWMRTFLKAMVGNKWSIVIDESHHVKGWRRKNEERGVPGSMKNRAGAVKELSLAAHRRLTTTGTPIRNRVKDLWAELDLTEPNAWGSSWDFNMRYADARPTSYGGLDANGESNVEELRARVDTVVHRVSYEEVQREMPEKVRTVVRIPESELIPMDKIDKSVLPASGIARQIALATLRKTNAVVDLVRARVGAAEDKRKVAVFTYLRRDCEAIAEELRLDSTPTLTAHGGVNVEKRDKIRVRFMTEPGPMVLVGTGDAWGEAVSLNDTDVAIFSTLPLTPGQLEQYEGRFHRKGQTKRVEIVYVVGVGTADEHIANLLLSKLPAVESQVSLGGAESTTAALETAIGMGDAEMQDRLIALILGGAL